MNAGYALLWIALAAGVWLEARSSGHAENTAVRWGLVVLLTGPLGLVVYVLHRVGPQRKGVVSHDESNPFKPPSGTHPVTRVEWRPVVLLVALLFVLLVSWVAVSSL